MATLIISFGSEKEAREAVERLSSAGLGDVRARVLDSSEPLSHDKTDTTSPMIVPELGTIEVRPTETPKTSAVMHDGGDHEDSAGIPTVDDEETDGVQVMIEMGDANEAAVRRLLGIGAEG